MLIGTALVVFNANVQFLIENFLSNEANTEENWWTLMESEAGSIFGKTKENFVRKNHQDIVDLFNGLKNRRNRIIHSFQFSHEDSSQGIATLVRKTHEQFEIDETYLLTFIRDNGKLNDLLHEFRGY
ncbi:hypothetical protein FD25_GL002363 [Levilactobacillus acidifarinae DSM 19394]|uniref:Selenium binding protein n=2 Tax=Levilactobacillus acidifarinae TaxID=267364 RepID=A0A0R1LJC1_9LACO|nr:hypothetical protein FD25_GL002363 [Levilactobacillus acidifarinae DSM 19394]